MALFALDDISPDLPAGFCFVAEDAAVIGNVGLGEDVGVWFGAVIRGDNERIVVGDRTNIQEHCVLHTDPGYPLEIGTDCTIGHRATLHGCTIGAGTLIGMSATVLNGARIGKGCLIGAGALVTENKHIPDGSLVLGAPGRVMRQLDDREAANILLSSKHYVRRAHLFSTRLRRVDRPAFFVARRERR